MSLQIQILIVEDDPGSLAALKMGLRDEGFTVQGANSVSDSNYYIKNWQYDVIIIDVNIEEGRGLALIKQWRASGIQTPIIIVSSHCSTEDKVRGLHVGADDYLSKPYILKELVARLHALLRRACNNSQPDFTLNTLVIDYTLAEVRYDGELVLLTNQEYAILLTLALRVGQIVSRDTLFDRISPNTSENDSNLLDVLICNLRRKLGKSIIQTVRGRGYRLSN